VKVHILNGDCLQYVLQAENALVVREMLVEGPLKADSEESFFHLRADYLEKTYGIPASEYQQKTVSEFKKMHHIPKHSEVYLWFDFDLYCFVHLLFIIELLQADKTLQLYVVRPLRKRKFRIWRGFDLHTKDDLMQAFSQKTPLSRKDIQAFRHVWKRLGKKGSGLDHRLVPFLQKHLQDYPQLEKATKIEARWGLTEGQITRILS
jgi:Domain of unknown function (DUF1835)